MAPELQEERDKCNFDRKELEVIMLGGPERYKLVKDTYDFIENTPEIRNHSRFYQMSVTEQQTDLWRRLKWLCTHRNDLWLNTNVYKFPFFFWFHHIQGLLPGFGLNYTMFHAVVQACANEE